MAQWQGGLQGLALLCIELDLTKTIDSVASKKDRKAPQYKQVVSTKLNLYCVKNSVIINKTHKGIFDHYY